MRSFLSGREKHGNTKVVEGQKFFLICDKPKAEKNGFKKQPRHSLVMRGNKNSLLINTIIAIAIAIAGTIITLITKWKATKTRTAENI